MLGPPHGCCSDRPEPNGSSYRSPNASTLTKTTSGSYSPARSGCVAWRGCAPGDIPGVGPQGSIHPQSRKSGRLASWRGPPAGAASAACRNGAVAAGPCHFVIVAVELYRPVPIQLSWWLTSAQPANRRLRYVPTASANPREATSQFYGGAGSEISRAAPNGRRTIRRAVRHGCRRRKSLRDAEERRIPGRRQADVAAEVSNFRRCSSFLGHRLTQMNPDVRQSVFICGPVSLV